MWKVPKGAKVRHHGEWVEREYISFPVSVLVDGKSIPRTIFSDGTAINYGFKPVRQQGYDEVNYRATPVVWENADEEVRDWKDIVPKMTVSERRELFLGWLKDTTVPNVRLANEMIRDLADISRADPDIAKWTAYKEALVVGLYAINREVGAIDDYDALVVYIKCESTDDPPVPKKKYGYSIHVPIQPGNEPIGE